MLCRTAELSFSYNDYAVRVQMNIILLRLDETVATHRQFAEIALDELLALTPSEKYMHHFVFVNQIEHRWKVRKLGDPIVKSLFQHYLLIRRCFSHVIIAAHVGFSNAAVEICYHR